MDNFYDINNFLMFIIKKLKNIIVIVCVITIVFAGNRAVQLLNQYRNQSNNVSSDTVEETSEPLWARVIHIISVEPQYKTINGVQVNQSDRIIDTMRKLSYCDELLNDMYSEWFEKEKAEDLIRKQNFYKYGYILEKEAKYSYTRYDFYQQFIASGTDLGSLSRANALGNDSDTISIGFRSTNKELTEKISNAYMRKLIALTIKELGNFKYSELGVSTLYDLPSRSAGAQPTRIANNSTASSDNITFAYMVKQTIKGVIWGILLGIVIAALLIFLMYMMSHKANTAADLKKYGVKILGLGFITKKRHLKMKAGLYKLIEGQKWDNTGYQNIAAKVTDHLDLQDHLLVVSSANEKYLQPFLDTLKQSSNIETIDFIGGDSLSLNCISKYNKVLLAEVFEQSLKDEIQSEVKTLTESNIDVIGMVGLQ